MWPLSYKQQKASSRFPSSPLWHFPHEVYMLPGEGAWKRVSLLICERPVCSESWGRSTHNSLAVSHPIPPPPPFLTRGRKTHLGTALLSFRHVNMTLLSYVFGLICIRSRLCVQSKKNCVFVLWDLLITTCGTSLKSNSLKRLRTKCAISGLRTTSSGQCRKCSIRWGAMGHLGLGDLT